MKKTLLFSTAIFVTGFFNAQVLQQVNFESFSIGSIIGQDSYQQSGGANPDFQVISSGTDKDLKIVGSSTTDSKYLWKDGLDACLLYTSRCV